VALRARGCDAQHEVGQVVVDVGDGLTRRQSREGLA
jgi:hypothetical protein